MPNVAVYLDILNTSNFIPHVNIPTRTISNTILDHVFSNISNNTTCSIQVSLVDSLITDRYPSVTQLINNNCNNNLYNMKSQTFHKNIINYNQLNILINNFDWRDIINSKSDTDKQLLSLTIFLQNLINRCTVTKSFKPISVRYPWIQPGIIASIKKRDKLRKLSRQQPFDMALKNKYKTYRNKLTEIISKAKQTYFGEKINGNLNNPKKIWSTIKQATQCQSDTAEISLKLNNITYNSIYHPSLIANKFNDHFLSMGNHSIKSNVNNNNRIIANPCSSLYFRKISNIEILNIISNMKKDAAAGFDGLSINVLKHIKKSISGVLAHIFNQILREGIIPSSFKKAIVIPVYKSGLKSDLKKL